MPRNPIQMPSTEPLSGQDVHSLAVEFHLIGARGVSRLQERLRDLATQVICQHGGGLHAASKVLHTVKILWDAPVKPIEHAHQLQEDPRRFHGVELLEGGAQLQARGCVVNEALL